MKRTLGILVLIATATVSVFGQTTTQSENSSACNLLFAQAPAIRGLKLGMSIEELATTLYSDKNKLPSDLMLRSVKKYPTYGRHYIQVHRDNSSFYNYDNNSKQISLPQISTDSFQGVSSIYIGFFDDQMTSFRIDYGIKNEDQRLPVWNNVKEVIEAFSKTYHLPAAPAWSIQSPERASLSCTDFKVDLIAPLNEDGHTAIALSMLKNFDSIMQKRQEEDRQKRREAFKP